MKQGDSQNQEYDRILEAIEKGGGLTFSSEVVQRYRLPRYIVTKKEDKYKLRKYAYETNRCTFWWYIYLPEKLIEFKDNETEEVKMLDHPAEFRDAFPEELQNHILETFKKNQEKLKISKTLPHELEGDLTVGKLLEILEKANPDDKVLFTASDGSFYKGRCYD